MNFAKIFRTSFFTEKPPVATSENRAFAMFKILGTTKVAKLIKEVSS